MSVSIYSHLKKDNFEIRILDILPSESYSEPVECVLRTISLAANPIPRYTALSYTWGPYHHVSDITVNNAPCNVTSNLASALRHLRHNKESISVWADAVCINQNDDKEKTEQLFIMEDVYRDAEKVLAWLGVESGDSSLAMKMIQRWASGEVRYLANKESSSGLLVGSNQDEAFGKAAMTAINNLLQRPYWTRMWVQQEVALAQSVIVQCGRDSLPFDIFVQAHSEWERKRKRIATTPDFVQNWQKLAVPMGDNETSIHSLIKLRQEQQSLIAAPEQTHSHRTSLFDFLRSYQHLQSTDPRDRIYALLGLYSPMSRYRSQIQPSYQKKAHEVFCDVARVLIDGDHSLRAAAFARNLSSSSPVTSLPSWVPDWTGTEVLYPLHAVSHGKCQDSRSEFDISSYVRIAIDGRTLSVRGALCDRVSALHANWAKIYQNKPTGLLNLIQGRALPNGHTVIQSIFHLLCNNLEPTMTAFLLNKQKLGWLRPLNFYDF